MEGKIKEKGKNNKRKKQFRRSEEGGEGLLGRTLHPKKGK